MTNRFGLSEATINNISSVLVRHSEINKAILYGSRAMDTFKNGSDIDLTLVGENDVSHQTLCKIMNELDELLLPYTIDLSIFSDIVDKDVIDHINRVGKVFYEKKSYVNL